MRPWALWGGRAESVHSTQFGRSLIQATEHVSLAALPSPSATFLTKLPQVLLEVFVEHGSVRLRLTLGLHRRTRQ